MKKAIKNTIDKLRTATSGGKIQDERWLVIAQFAADDPEHAKLLEAAYSAFVKNFGRPPETAAQLLFSQSHVPSDDGL